MKKEKLIITCELEDFPDNAHLLDFSVTVIEDSWISKIFTNWKKISFKKVTITSLEKK